MSSTLRHNVPVDRVRTSDFQLWRTGTMSTPVQPMVICCPFCQCPEIEFSRYYFQCVGCAATGPMVCDGEEEQARRLWNRHEFTAKDLEAKIIEELQAWGDHLGVEVADIVSKDAVPPIWQQIRGLLNRLHL